MSAISNDVTTELKNSSSLLRALEAIRNPRALLSLLVGALMTVVSAGILYAIAARLGMSGHGLLAGLFGLLGVIATLLLGTSAYSACGLHLHRQFAGLPPQSLLTGFLAALTTVPRFLLVGLLIGAAALLTMLALLIVYFICRLPGLGPLLYFVCLPAGTLAVAIMVFALIFLSPLAGPAIWAGGSTLQVVSALWLILRRRLLSVVIQSLILGFLVWVVSTLVLIGFGASVALNAGLSTLAIGSLGGNLLSGMMALFSPYGGGGQAASYLLAGGAGMGLLTLLLAMIPLLITTAGGCLIFQGVARDLDIAALASSWQEGLDKTRERVRKAGEDMQSAPASGSAALARSCPACHAELPADAVFCGNCGQRLEA